MLKDRFVAIDGEISKYFTGNTCGLYCEAKGWRGNRAFARSRSPMAEEVRNRGAAAFAPELSPGILSQLVRLLDAFEAYRDTGKRGADIEEWMVPALTVLPRTVRLSADLPVPPGLLASVADVVKNRVARELALTVEPLGITLYRNRRNEQLSVISGDWHFDRRPTDWMRAFIYLSDVTLNCGPFHYFDKSVSAALCRDGFTRHSSQWQIRAESRQSFHRLLGSAGSGLVVNAERVLHRAGNPDEGCHRDMFEFIFRPRTR